MNSLQQLLVLTLIAPVAVFTAGCSAGKAHFQLVDKETGAAVASQVLLFERGSGSTELGYYFCDLRTDRQGLVIANVADIDFRTLGKSAPPPDTGLNVYYGDVIAFRVAGYKPAEVHVGYGSMTVSESVGSLRVIAALDESAREISFKNGDLVRISLSRQSPATTSASR